MNVYLQVISNNALKTCESRTKKDLLAHPLAAQLQASDSPSTILSILDRQVQELDQSRSSGDRWTRWLGPTVSVLYAFSATLGGRWTVCIKTRADRRFILIVISQVFSPAKVIFASVGVLLSVRLHFL